MDETPAPDRLLAHFVGLAERSNATMLLTLTVQGVTISGILSSSIAYCDALSDIFATAIVDPDTARGWQHAFRQVATMNRGEIDALDASGPITLGADAHIHLRDASLLLATGSRLTLGWWRGRLSSIDGWVIGA